MDLKSRAVELRDKIDALSSRERVIVAVTIVAVIFGVYDQLVLNPFLKKKEKLQQQMASMVPEVERIGESIESLIKRQEMDPNIKLREKIGQKKIKIRDLDEVIRSETRRLIDPERMPQILGYLLSRQSALNIESVKSVSGEPIYFDKEKKEESGLFQHDLNISLEGTYYQVQGYLKHIENMAEQIYWDDMEFEVKAYPVGRLNLNVHTLSTSQDLIGVY